MKEKRKSKNQSYNKRFMIIAGILLLILIFNVAMMFLFPFDPCCYAYTTETPRYLTNEAIGQTETQSVLVFATMTAEAP